MFNTDEKKARKVIDTLISLKGENGVDTFINLGEEYLKVRIEQYGKKLLSTKFNLDNLTEMTHDEVSYVLFESV